MTDSTNGPDGNRRAFLRGAAGGTALGALGMMGAYSYSPMRRAHFDTGESEKADIGAVKSLKVTNISETSWFSNTDLIGDIRGAGGLLVNQYKFNWPPFADKNGKLAGGSYADGIKHIKADLPNNLERAWEFQMDNAVHPENAGGYSALLEFEMRDGSTKRILLDSGWSYDWIDKAFQREGIDTMLANGEIDALVISHEHFDHFWGFPVSMKYAPDIDVYVPDGFYEEGYQYIKDSGHRGKLHVLKPGLTTLFDGVALYNFAIPIITRVYGEMSLYVNIEDKGLVSVTGCCHQGIIRFAETAQKEIKMDKLYGIYGGLHISPFDDWDPKYDDLVFTLGDYGFEKIGANHCTGLLTVKKFIARGLPVVQGTARFGSKDPVYLGNGDQIGFGREVALMSPASAEASPAAISPAASGGDDDTVEGATY